MQMIRVVSICIVLTVLIGSSLVSHAASTRVYNVALVDRFYPGAGMYSSKEERELDQALYGFVDLDGDKIRDPLYHGDLVQLIVQHPQIRVRPYVMSHGKPAMQQLLHNLELIRRDLFWDEPIDAVLIPWESSTLISAFDTELHRESVDQYLDILRTWAGQHESWRLTLEIILVLEDIVDYGGLVFTISGNGGARMVNTYSFAEGVITVGAEEQELSHYISNNPFVDRHSKAAYHLQRIDDSEGMPIGYDVDGDHCSDITVNWSSDIANGRNTLPKKYWKPLIGSSFAAPMALKRYLLGRNYRPACQVHALMTQRSDLALH